MICLSVGEFLDLHHVLAAMVEQKLGALRVLPQSVQGLVSNGELKTPEGRIPETDHQWLELLDLAVTPFELRRYVREQGTERRVLDLFIRFLISKESHSPADIEKVDWLLTSMFRNREAQSKLQGGWYKNEIQELLKDFEFPPFSRRVEELLAGFPPLLEEIKYAERFSQLTESRTIERGRELKSQFGEEFFHPLVLAATVNYNLLLESKLQRLLRTAADQLPETHELRETIGPDPEKALQTDYRMAINANVFWRVGELEKKRRMEEEQAEQQRNKEARQKPEPPKVAVNREPSELENLRELMKQRGIDPSRQAQRLRDRLRDIKARFQRNPGFTSIPTGLGTLRFDDWELKALRQEQLEGDESFQSQVAGNISYALGIILRVQEEIYAYYETKGIESQWKSHCEALFYLRHEGRRHKKELENLVTKSKNLGLLEKAQQIGVTITKLESTLEKITGLKEPSWLVEAVH